MRHKSFTAMNGYRISTNLSDMDIAVIHMFLFLSLIEEKGYPNGLWKM